ncbi:unnamed protein product [Lota lota]
MLNMGAVLVLLIGVTDGVKTFCNATQPYITTQCFGSLGGTVEVHLPAQSSQNDTYALKKNNVLIAKPSAIITDTRYSFNVSTGIFTIKDVKRSDNGTYSMVIHNVGGIEIANVTWFLSIQGLVPIIAGSLSAMALLLIVALGIYCAKKKSKSSKDTTEAEEVTYADISVLQQQGQQREQRESEVEYGQVKVAPGLRQTLETKLDDCVLSAPKDEESCKHSE